MSALSGRVSSVAAMEHLIHVLRRVSGCFSSLFPGSCALSLRPVPFVLVLVLLNPRFPFAVLQASPFPALDSGGLRDLRFLLTMKINETSYRRKTRLQPVVAQLALGLADWSRCSSAAIARVLTLLPE